MQTRLYYDEEEKCYLEEEVTEGVKRVKRNMNKLAEQILMQTIEEYNPDKSLHENLAAYHEMITLKYKPGETLLKAAFCPEDKRGIYGSMAEKEE